MGTNQFKNICVFCGSTPGNDPVFLRIATEFGGLLATNDFQLIYGGGNTGLMGAVANGTLNANGKVIGVIPTHLAAREVGHRGLTELITVPSMHERKTKMAELADAFVVLPGGAGTLEEALEQWTWMQLGFHQKPIAFLNTERFFDPLFHMVDQMVSKGFMSERFANFVICEPNPSTLLERISAPHSPPS